MMVIIIKPGNKKLLKLSRGLLVLTEPIAVVKITIKSKLVAAGATMV